MPLTPRQIHKRLALTKLNNAIKEGKIIRPDRCSSCGKQCKPEGHHHDYKKPLEAVFLCKLCHKAAHRLVITNLLKAAEDLISKASPALIKKLKPLIKKEKKELAR